jgi:uncharacterized protein YbjT (DUF2867 family)
MRVLITGATGFVGSYAIEALAEHPDVITIAACRDPSRLPSTFQGEVRVGDLRDENYLDRLMSGIDIIVHAAAWTSLRGHQQQSDEQFLKPSLALIEAARRQAVKRFIFSAILPRDAARTHAEQLMVMAQGASLMAHIREDPQIVHRHATLMCEWLRDICTES